MRASRPLARLQNLPGSRDQSGLNAAPGPPLKTTVHHSPQASALSSITRPHRVLPPAGALTCTQLSSRRGATSTTALPLGRSPCTCTHLSAAPNLALTVCGPLRAHGHAARAQAQHHGMRRLLPRYLARVPPSARRGRRRASATAPAPASPITGRSRPIRPPSNPPIALPTRRVRMSAPSAPVARSSYSASSSAAHHIHHLRRLLKAVLRVHLPRRSRPCWRRGG